jgi:hypothetical protein
MLETVINTKRKRYKVPWVNMVVSADIHEAVKIYAYSRNMMLRDATEHLLKLALQIEYRKEEPKE